MLIVGCAALFFVASLIWYLNRSVTITLNGAETSVRINANINQIIEDEGLADTCEPGNLLAVDDSVLERGGGDSYHVTLDGTFIDEADYGTTEVTGGEELEITDGDDVYEEHTVDATVIEPTITVSGSGAIGYVETWGIPGRSEVWTGEESGLTEDRGVVEEVQDCEVVYHSVTPDEGTYVALTFDEGPSSYTQQILDILEEKGVQATFFVQGDAVAANEDAVQAIADSGNELGSNGYSDVVMTDLTGDSLRDQINQGFDAIEAACGQRVYLFRAPYAAFSTQNWAEAMDQVSAVVSWNIDSGDWLLPGADTVIENVMGSLSNGNIVLLTDNETTGAQLVEALPDLIDRLQSEGYEIVTLSDLIATDEDLASELDLSTVSMPDDAVLPQVSSSDDAADSDNSDESSSTDDASDGASGSADDAADSE